jgi:hypothetical protein
MADLFENVVDCCVALYGEDLILFSSSITAAVTIANQRLPWMPSRSMLDFVAPNQH